MASPFETTGNEKSENKIVNAKLKIISLNVRGLRNKKMTHPFSEVQI